MVDVLVLKSLLLCVGTLSLELLCCVQPNWRHKSLRLCYVPIAQPAVFDVFPPQNGGVKHLTQLFGYFSSFELHSSLLNGKSEWLTVHNGMFPALWTKPTRRRPRKIKTSFLITQQIQIDIPILDTLLACGRTWLGNWYLLLFVCISNKKTVFKTSKLFWHLHPSCDIQTAQWILSLTLKLSEEWSSQRNQPWRQDNKFIWYIWLYDISFHHKF